MPALGLVLLFLITLIKCDSDSTPYVKTLPQSVGSSGELIVIIGQQHQESPGNSIRKEFQKTIPSYFSYEPQFDVEIYTHSDFSKLIRQFRNLLIVDIKDNEANKEASTVIKKDVWALDQMVVYIHAKDSAEFLEIFEKDIDKIKEVFNYQDRLRYQSINASISDPIAQEKIQNKFDLTIDIPSDFILVSEGDNHLSYQLEKMDYLSGRAYQVVQNIIIRVQPFVTDSVFSHSFIIDQINTKTGKIYQSTKDVGLSIEEKFHPIFTEINLNGNFGVETKTLWKFEEPLMGGPYTSITVHDPKKNRIITVEGFLFAPKFNYREYMKQIEAILYSLEY